jgi:hypothetical protein
VSSSSILPLPPPPPHSVSFTQTLIWLCRNEDPCKTGIHATK